MEKEAPPSPPPAKSKWKSWRFLLFALLFVLGLLFVVGFVFFQTHSTESSATFAFRSPDGRYEFLGRKLTITDGFYFSGLPYAEAFRFSAAERVDLFMNETATVWPRECPSAYFSRGAEECLKLNIYRCGDAMRGVFLPVLVYVPEGEPDSESSANLDPLHVINNLACRGMVVVSVHYRQDVFSQFTLGERILKPNLGVLDVRAAIEWVHENIEKFFGDNSRVTVMGSKNGARILSYLSRVPQVKHLFSNMILVDGALESPQLFPSTRDLLVQQSRRFSNLLACSRPTDDFERMSKRQFGQVMACLRRTRRPAILRAEMKMRGGFVKWPLDSTAVRDAAIPPMNVMLGTCHAPDPPLTERNPRVVQKLRATLQRTPDFNRTADPNAFVEHYAQHFAGLPNVRAATRAIRRDFAEVGPLVLEAIGISEANALNGTERVFAFDLQTNLSRMDYDRVRPMARRLTPCLEHLLFKKVPEQDVGLRKYMIDSVVNFVQWSDPNLSNNETRADALEWPEFNALGTTPSVLSLNAEGVDLVPNPWAASARFWLCQQAKATNSTESCG